MYYRPGNRMTPVVKGLIIANVIVWILQIYFAKIGFNLEEYGALWTFQTGNFKVWQLVTHMFMHDTGNPEMGNIDIMHILFNMIALFIFGHHLEDRWGSKRFLEFYMICGLGAAVAELMIGQAYAVVGASGAIMGLMAAFAYLFPNTEMFIGFIPFPIKMKYIAIGTILIDLFGGLDSSNNDHIAHWAHLGGAFVGLVLVIYSNRTNRKTFY